ncbi:hypothetical protein [Pectobacterium versatile]|uniref:hypothetical protein n=1 Tax=Pectobacterium versatile TaxID=2488639 RepID=UPI00102EF244|nr:hypothetical protein [Pectobacterium versatile]MBN3194775.1 hypothetical protein [Pectobacterium versatile]TAI96825.1 hypothetical protein EG335_11755 [Pectobacterium versatile]
MMGYDLNDSAMSWHENYTNKHNKIFNEIMLKRGVLDIETFNYFKDAMRCINFIEAYNSLITYVTFHAKKEIKDTLLELIDIAYNSFYLRNNDLSVFNSEKVARLIKIESKKYPFLLSADQIDLLIVYIFLSNSDFHSKRSSILRVLESEILTNQYISKYKNVFLERLKSINISSFDVNNDSPVEIVKKRGPRNEHYQEAVNIIEDTLVKYPDVSTYSLAKKLVSYFGNYKNPPSDTTLKRWIEDVREPANEPYTKKFKLIHRNQDGLTD